MKENKFGKSRENRTFAAGRVECTGNHGHAGRSGNRGALFAVEFSHFVLVGSSLAQFATLGVVVVEGSGRARHASVPDNDSSERTGEVADELQGCQIRADVRKGSVDFEGAVL